VAEETSSNADKTFALVLPQRFFRQLVHIATITSPK
jgi:hypothetical protein